MSTRSHQKAVWIGLGLTLAAALALGLVGGVLASKGAGLPLGVQLGVLALIVALGYPASLPWWRKLDEMARQAHLTSWFWGAQIGGGMALVAAAVLAIRGETKIDFFYGAGLVLAVQLGAYAVIWAGWWLLRRGGQA